MKEKNKTILVKRTKSFIWRLGAVCAIAILNFIANQIGLFDLPVLVVGIIGLVIGEVTKYLNVNLPKIRAEEIVDRPIPDKPQ